MINKWIRPQFCAATMAVALLSGCASQAELAQNPDPYEHYNRSVFKFNLVVDKAVFRPVAKAYDKIVPTPVDKGVTNFFSNLNDVTHIPNDILQGNLALTLSDTWRVIFNTTLGIGGFFDVSTSLGLPKHTQDFGLTLARWGVRQSPYFLIPFLGPGTIRDQAGSLVDRNFFSVYSYINSDTTRYSLYGLHLVDQRAALLPTDRLVDTAFDPYIFVRDAYLQRRTYQIEQTVNKQGARGTSISETSGINSVGIH